MEIVKHTLSKFHALIYLIVLKQEPTIEENVLTATPINENAVKAVLADLIEKKYVSNNRGVLKIDQIEQTEANSKIADSRRKGASFKTVRVGNRSLKFLAK